MLNVRSLRKCGSGESDRDERVQRVVETLGRCLSEKVARNIIQIIDYKGTLQVYSSEPLDPISIKIITNVWENENEIVLDFYCFNELLYEEICL
jgi:hypothetical protein